ncbi:hypothetical protein [Streptomyces albireticuli]|uniref:hypothetical protein n=1 Tax=Streptomyces albireticuli TaxID=1940 RepID=UPI0036AA680B
MSHWVLLVLLLPFLWWLTVPLLVGYQLARTARRTARRVFPVLPAGRVEDPEVLRVQRLRTWVALAVTGVLLTVFGGWQEVPGDVLQQLVLAPWFLLLIAAVAVLLLLGVARPGMRRAMRTQLWPVGRSALCYLGAWTLVPLLFTAAGKGMGLLPSSADGLFGVLLWVSVMFVCWAPFWWVIFFLYFASGPALRHLQPVRPARGAARAGHHRPGLGVRLPRPVVGRSAAGPGAARGLRVPRWPGVGVGGGLVGDSPAAAAARGAVAGLAPRSCAFRPAGSVTAARMAPRLTSSSPSSTRRSVARCGP